jgi:hypothetical protein
VTPRKGGCTHQFANGEWNGCGAPGVLVDSEEIMGEEFPQYRCAEHFPEWLADAFKFKLKTHKQLARIVRMYKTEDNPPDILDLIAKDELATGGEV